MRNSPRKKYRLHLIQPSEMASPDPSDILAKGFSTEYVQVPFDFDSLPDEEETPCAQS